MIMMEVKNKQKITIEINGEVKNFEIDPSIKLSDLLRENGYFGVKIGCRNGDCGVCIILLEGRFGVADPQRVIDGPKNVMKRGNKLYDEAESIDFYENDEERMIKLSEEWDILLEKYRGFRYKGD